MSRALKQGLRRLAQAAVVWSVERSTARPFLNRIYQSLNPPQQEFFHREFAKLFRDRQAHGRDGVWHLSFLGRSVLAPLTMERLWLDWDTAVSILGHDGDIKETYRALLTAPQPPDLFVDICRYWRKLRYPLLAVLGTRSGNPYF